MSADPAFRGFVETTLDALLIFEGCRRGSLPKITRRLQEFEKRALVVSGAVFVFDEEETGIKRWTDGLSWSPSRTLGNFLVYRELDKKAGASGAAAGAAGTDENGLGDGLDELPSGEGSAGPSSLRGPSQQATTSSRRRSLSDTSGATPPLDRARERALVGSLTSTYRFRSDGLVKKTISISGLHMIGYYRIDDVTSGRLRTPSSHAELISLEVSSDFLSPSHFRVPPIVEVTPEGLLTYKAEADAPMSPLTRSGSSQGFGTPAVGQPRSRPPSSDSNFGRPASPRTAPLPLTTSQRDPPNSPHRGSSATFRSTNRYDPYAVGRCSPNPGSYQQPPAYPFPDGQHSRQPTPPGRASFPVLAGVEEMYQPCSDPTTGLSPSLGMLSSSAPSDRQWGRSSLSGPSQQPIPLNRQNSDQAVPTFYQPRHATPFAPGDTNPPPTAPTSSIFAYQPPPPLNRSLPPSGRPSPPSAYQSYNAPISSGSAPPQSFGSSNGRMQYTAPTHPPQSRNIQQSPFSQHVPQHSQSPGQHGLHANAPPSGSTYSPISQHRRSSLHNGTLQPASTGYDYAPPTAHQPAQSPYSTYTIPSSHSPHQSTYSYPESRNIYSEPRQPSGMVMPLGSGDLDEERHGLGLGTDPHLQLRSSGGRSSDTGTPQEVYRAGGGPMLSNGGGLLGSDDDRFAPRSVKREQPQDAPQWWAASNGAAPQQHQSQHPMQHQHQSWGGPVKDEYS